MFNLEGLLPKLCRLAKEVGEDERGLRLRSAGLQALACMVWLFICLKCLYLQLDVFVCTCLCISYAVLTICKLFSRHHLLSLQNLLQKSRKNLLSHTSTTTFLSFLLMNSYS